MKFILLYYDYSPKVGELGIGDYLTCRARQRASGAPAPGIIVVPLRRRCPDTNRHIGIYTIDITQIIIVAKDAPPFLSPLFFIFSYDMAN